MAVSSLTRMTVPLASDQSAVDQGLLMPKLQYRFRVIFENFGVSTPRTELTKQVMDFTRPTVNFPEIEVPVYDIPAPVQEKVEVTEDKTVSEFAGFSVEFTVEGIENFVPFEELTEEIVLDWIPESVIQPYLAQHEEKLLLEQDKILNPLKYQKDSPVPPWNPPKIENTTVLDPSSEG